MILRRREVRVCLHYAEIPKAIVEVENEGS